VTIIGALLGLAPAASAATPFTAGFGFGHDLAVGSDGTGHVVWLQDEDPGDRVHYCRVPSGGSACDSESDVFSFPGPVTSAFSIGDQAQVFTPAPGKVVILGSCFSCGATGGPDRVWRWTSTNNGVSFGGPVEIGDIALNGQAGHIETGNPTTDITLGVEGGLFEAMNGTAPPETAEQSLGGGGSFVYGSAIVYDPTTDKAVHVVNSLDSVRFAYLTDPTPTAAELNTLPTSPLADNEWHTGNALPSPEGDNDETHLSVGPNGIFLSYEFFVPNNSRLGVRKFDPATNSFGSPVYAEGPDAIDNNSLDYPNHSQDPSGRLHFVWRTLHDDNRLRYTRSDDGGATFSPAANLAIKETFIDPIVESGPAGSGPGFAVWKGIGSSDIRVVVIDPQPEPVTPPPGGGPDTTAPTAGDLGIGDATLFPGQGTSFTFNSSEAGMAKLTVEKQVPGLRMRIRGRLRCVPQTRKRLRALRRQAGSPAAFRRLLRKRRCKAYKRIGSIQRAVAPGQNTIDWNGRIAGRRLRPGRYRALLVITDSAGNKSSVERIRFRVLRRRR
jgi:hypothetical protein